MIDWAAFLVVAVATLVAAGGSRKSLGRRAIFLAGAEPLGSVTLGGCAEGLLRKAAAEVRVSGQSTLLDVNLGGDEAYEFGMTCAGAVTVQLDPLSLPSALWAAAAQARAGGEVLRLVTPLGEGAVPFLLTQAGAVVADWTGAVVVD